MAHESSEGCFVGICDVEEAVGVLSLLVNVGHEGVALQEVLAVDEEVQRVFLGQLDPLPNDVVEVVSREIVGHEVLGLVNVGQL